MDVSKLSSDLFTQHFNSGHPLFLRGGAGVGKTAKVEQWCETASLGCVSLFLPATDAVDMMGFLIPSKQENGEAVSQYTKPNWLVRIEDAISRGMAQGVLLFDEFPASDTLTQKAAAPLMSEGRIGQWHLPEGWVVWLTGNRPKDKAGSSSMLGHVSNRMCTLDVVPVIDGWKEWAIEQGMHPLYISFAMKFPGVVFNDEPPKDPNEPRCTARSFTFAHDFHAQTAQGNVLASDAVTLESVQGFIGKGASASLMSYLKVSDELPEIEDIVADPMTAKLPKATRLDAQFAAVQMLVHHAKPENIDTLWQYAERLNKELQTSAASQLMKRSGGALLNSAALTKWISANRALITASHM